VSGVFRELVSSVLREFAVAAPSAEFVRGDMERGTPHPRERVTDVVSPTKNLGEGLCHGVVRDLRVARVGIHRSPDARCVVAIRPLHAILGERRGFFFGSAHTL
jgi:hypothetical protein